MEGQLSSFSGILGSVVYIQSEQSYLLSNDIAK